ncbi:MAG: hypothetical protein JWM10_3221, partial [Myxococcaceae bacterium]|nr:hypothetical protein [Myxococcaceae bacterium]
MNAGRRCGWIVGLLLAVAPAFAQPRTDAAVRADAAVRPTPTPTPTPTPRGDAGVGPIATP